MVDRDAGVKPREQKHQQQRAGAEQGAFASPRRQDLAGGEGHQGNGFHDEDATMP
jgi:hypothetical protein